MNKLPVYLTVTAMALVVGCCCLSMVPGLAIARERSMSCLTPGGSGGFSKADQMANARTIVEVGVKLRVPRRGIVVAIVAAMTESDLVNMSGGHLDSAGLFQMRPSMGWGSYAQVTDPVYASTKFYSVLLKVPNWQSLPLDVAAQKVERSGRPDRYGQFVARAEAMVAKILGSVSPSTGAQLDQDPCGIPPKCGDVDLSLTLPADTPPAVRTAIGWALRQCGTSYVYGGDCTDAHSSNLSKHCDCSSLMQMAYRAAGYSIPRVTFDQINLPMRVPGLSQVRPGDLLFKAGAYGTPSNPGHVGMYIGSGLIVEAPKTGELVQINTLARWSRSVVGIRRVVPANRLV
ncbi:C40 family peptidase [Dactylosporangium roseum]|uniref:C40 family peptidase n=1 Tax=Dactylosporangium roseum TaxID=47989 RepID=A0ABY5Z0Q3_9ACTN|nr:C40 family peptidase [Dactylosporangium roseum]UWZ34452.1 C40 family peptidase [Dactylosporangium roseum]